FRSRVRALVRRRVTAIAEVSVRLRVAGILVRNDLQARRRAVDNLATVLEIDTLDDPRARWQLEEHALAGMDRVHRLRERATVRKPDRDRSKPYRRLQRDELEVRRSRRVRSHVVGTVSRIGTDLEQESVL